MKKGIVIAAILVVAAAVGLIWWQVSSMRLPISPVIQENPAVNVSPTVTPPSAVITVAHTVAHARGRRSDAGSLEKRP